MKHERKPPSHPQPRRTATHSPKQTCRTYPQQHPTPTRPRNLKRLYIEPDPTLYGNFFCLGGGPEEDANIRQLKRKQQQKTMLWWTGTTGITLVALITVLTFTLWV